MFEADTILFELLWQLLGQSPLLIIWVLGLILALVTWKRHPTVSLLVVIAMLINLLGALFGTAMQLYLIRQLQWGGGLGGGLLPFLSFGRACMTMVAYILLFVAVFGWRYPPPPPRPPWEQFPPES